MSAVVEEDETEEEEEEDEDEEEVGSETVVLIPRFAQYNNFPLSIKDIFYLLLSQPSLRTTYSFLNRLLVKDYIIVFGHHLLCDHTFSSPGSYSTGWLFQRAPCLAPHLPSVGGKVHQSPSGLPERPQRGSRHRKGPGRHTHADGVSFGIT